jgi:hypothetical protein
MDLKVSCVCDNEQNSSRHAQLWSEHCLFLADGVAPTGACSNEEDVAVALAHPLYDVRAATLKALLESYPGDAPLTFAYRE